ncbi:MAG: tetratricopeptide repeat protein [Actinomycetota bacterium]
MKFSRFFLFTAFICAVLATASFNVSAKDEWLRVQSKNFQLIGNAGEKDLRRVATKLEQFRFVFTQLFPKMKFNSPIPTRVVVFKDEKSFKLFKPAEWVAGYFQPSDDINYIALSTEGEKEDTFRVIFHEYTHFLIDNSLGRSNIPPWFNEGIAEYYEQFLIENDQKVTLGGLSEGHLYLLQQNKFIPFENFFGIDYYSLHRQTKQSAQLFYAQSWALLHYLMLGNNGAKKPELTKFVDLLLQGTKPKEAFQQAFQSDYAAMETELRKYIEQRKFFVSIANFKEKLVFDKEMQTFPVSDAEAKSFQGDLLYHTNRLDEAEKVLNEALTLDANSSIANAALGLVKMRQKKFAEAKTYLEKAIQADAQNYLAYFSYAFVLSREGMTDLGFSSGYSSENADKMRENLQKSISLNPNFAEAYNLYAFISIVRNEELDESIAMIKKALAIAPGNQWYAVRLAELYMLKQDFTNARNLMQKILITASDDRLKVYAENTVRTINSLESQLEDIKNYKKREPSEAVSDTPLSDEEIAKRREKAMLESLNQTLRKTKSDEKRLLGYVTKIDCQPKQIIFSVTSDNQVLQLKSDSFETLTLISYENELVNSEFGCGVMKKENLSVITFRPNTDAKSKITGEIVSIEFVPKNFRFLEEGK